MACEERQAHTRTKLASLASLTPRQPSRRLLGYSFILSSLRHHGLHRLQRRLRAARKLCYTAKDAIRSHTTVEDESPDQMTELAQIDLPEIDAASLKPETTADDLEASTQKAGVAILKTLLQAQLEEVDAELTQKTRQAFPPQTFEAEGFATIEAVTRFGTLHLRRQVLSRKNGPHLIPANAFLPSHEGILITRGVQEWARLLPQKLPFASVARLLGWPAQ